MSNSSAGLRVAVHLLLIVAALPSLAQDRRRMEGSDRVGFGQDITVSAGETAGDVACAFCTVHIDGAVQGDVAAFFGSVKVERRGSIGGDVALVGGKIVLTEGTSVGGDVAIFGGNIAEDEGASIRGDRVVLPGLAWLLGIALAPILLLIGVVWLIVWLVRRSRYGPPIPTRW